MGQITLGEQAAPATPASGVTIYTTVATPSILRVINDSGTDSAIVLPGALTTFTASQTFAPTATNVDGIVINMPVGNTFRALMAMYNSVNRIGLYARSSITQLLLAADDLGNNVAGPQVIIQRTTNAGTEGPAPGVLSLVQANNTARYLWVDNAADLRIHSAAPTGSTGSPTVNITAGTVVGTQTSMAEVKLISDDLSTLDEVMERIRNGALAVRRFYTGMAGWGGQEFEGVVTDYAPAYGMDRDADHPQGKSLNEITMPGDLLRFASWAIERIEELTRRVAELEAKN